MWHYTSLNQQHGPVTWDELSRLAQSGRLRSNDLVWKEGTPDWIRASQVQDLFAAPEPGASAAIRAGQSRAERSVVADRHIGSSPETREESYKGLIIGLIVGVSALFTVLAVVVILTTETSPSDRSQREKEAKAAREIHDIDLAVMTYYTEMGFTEFPPSLEVLTTEKNRVGKVFLKNITDPWGARYMYSLEGRENRMRGEAKPDIYCTIPGGDGWVIANWASGKVRMGKR